MEEAVRLVCGDPCVNFFKTIQSTTNPSGAAIRRISSKTLCGKRASGSSSAYHQPPALLLLASRPAIAHIDHDRVL